MMLDSDKYTRSVNAVIDYINAHIDTRLDLQTLAAQTHLSVFHFQRVFTAVMGESPSRYVLRRRLELAAIQLRNDPRRPVTEIAFDYGFNSVNVFCRNFKKHFGMTAEAYRRKTSESDSKNRPSECSINPSQRSYSRYFCSRKTLKTGDKTMDCNFEIKHLEATHVVYCRHYGAYDNLQESFDKLMRWAYPRGLVTAESRLATIFHDNPEVTDVENRISDACLVVNGPLKTDGEVSAALLPGGRYAVGRFELEWKDFEAAWKNMFVLLEEHGCSCCGLPFEIYIDRSETHPAGKWVVDICIPVSLE